MNKFYNTISEISRIFTKNDIEFVVTRFNRNSLKEPDDLDILVKPNSFKKTVRVLEENGFRSLSHDEALGGRIKGMQVNLIKPSKIKIDLHQDFTWRASRYFNLDLVWKRLKTETAEGLEYPAPDKDVDTFIVVINIIFEKAYLKKEDYNYIQKSLDEISKNPLFETHATSHGWNKSFDYFIKWFRSIDTPNTWPVFLPFGLVINSYIEKFLQEKRFNIVSLLYYLFFRARFFLNGILPYN